MNFEQKRYISAKARLRFWMRAFLPHPKRKKQKTKRNTAQFAKTAEIVRRKIDHWKNDQAMAEYSPFDGLIKEKRIRRKMSDFRILFAKLCQQFGHDLPSFQLRILY